jgi:hypothetical protein
MTSGAVYADVIVFRDGRTIEGKIIKETDERITLKVRYGEVEILRSKIAEIKRGPTAYEQYEKKAKKVESTAQAHYKLGLWCVEKELREEAKKHHRKALEIDPAFAPAGKALGYEKVEGKWLSPDEAKKARGLVKFEGKWIPKEERDQILAERDGKKQDELRKKYEVGPDFFIASRKNFILVANLPEKKRKKLLEAAGALYNSMKERFGTLFVKKHDWPLVIFAFGKRDDYKERVKKDGLDEAVECHGYYSGKKKRAYIFDCASPDLVHMLLHEFTHQIYVERMMKWGPGIRSRAWIFEGLAEYHEGHDVKDGKLGKPKPHQMNLYRAKAAAREGKLIPIEKVIEADQLTELFEEYNSEECYNTYAQVWAMAYYLLEGDKGRHKAKFERFMKKDLRGEGTPEEFKRIFGSDLAKFQGRLEKFLKGFK